MKNIHKDKLCELGDGILCPIAIIEKEGKILTGLRHYKLQDTDTLSVWTLPGGRSEIGETIEQTLRREVLEEVGINELYIQDFVGQIPGSSDGDNVYIFHCTTDQESTLMEPEKFSEWRWVPIKEYIESEIYGSINILVYETIRDYFQK
jgi:8-oxo-dGTP pyrophosphatase MutT (NUDIX family)